MKLIKFPNTEEFSKNPKVFALGKFDSIHTGHRELLFKAKEEAKANNQEFGILLFSQRENENIFSLEERLMFLKEFDPNYIYEFEPKKENFSMTSEEFEQLLLDINVKTIVVGTDYGYGLNRKGNVNTLNLKFKTLTLDKTSVSTSEVINSIKESNFQKYKELMGQYFFYKGIVVRGKGNGRKFNMPTANVEYPKYKIDINEGIYFSYLIYDGKRMPSLTSISTNPTVNGENITYETYIYDFDEDIYGKEVYVEIIEKFRDPIKFNSIEELIEQLEKDKVTGREFFKK